MKTKIDVKHIAKLANLPLTSGEAQKFEKQLEETLAYIEQLNEVDTKGVTSTPQLTGLENVSDTDQVQSSLSQEEALKNSKSTHNGMFKVDAILDNSV